MPKMTKGMPIKPRGDPCLTAARLKALLQPPFVRADWDAVASEHLHLRIGNDPPATERQAGLDRLEAFLARIDGFGCCYCDLWQRRETVYAEADVRYRDPSGTVCEIPCTLVARIRRGRLLDLRLHLDPSQIPSAPI
jgi:hypothetical protein